MIVVADTSVLLNLCRIGEADLLWQLYGDVAAPRSVQVEFERAVLVYGRFDRLLGRFDRLLFPGFIRIHEPRQSLQALLPETSLDRGESDAIALSVELSADFLLIDEQKRRRAAAQLGIRFSGILGILVLAKQKSLIPEVRALLLRLREEAGFFLSERHMSRALLLAGESA